MIFVTVGSQLPLDRLIIAVDTWAGEHKDYPVFAQIGNSNYCPKNIAFCQTIPPETYNKYFAEATLIVAHARTGGIISALELSKPLLIMPRMADKGEHRNDHQLATVKHFSHLANIFAAYNETEIPYWLNKLLIQKEIENISTNTKIQVSASLIDVIKKFVS